MIPLNPKIAKKFIDEDIKFFDTVACLRFGGKCNSTNARCRRLREAGVSAVELLIAISIIGLVGTILFAHYAHH